MYWLPLRLEKPLDAYRARRKIERSGKMLTRQRAIDEILEAALAAEPDAKKLPTFESVVDRLEKVERLTACLQSDGT